MTGSDGEHGRALLDKQIDEECRLFTRYLIGEEPVSVIRERYRRACSLLVSPDEEQDEVLEFARRHPWAIGCLDAAAGVRDSPQGLRRRLLILTAILEATPHYTSHFLSRGESLPAIVLGVISAGVRTGLKLSLGIPLLLIARL